MYKHSSVLRVGLLSSLLVYAACSQERASSPATPADAVVNELRHLPAPIPAGCCGLSATPGEPPRLPASEVRREDLYNQLHALGRAAVDALARGYGDPDVRLRRNVAIALLILGGGYGPRAKLDISAALPALTNALTDADANVRAWSAQAIGHLGAQGAPAVPHLIELLRGDEGSRNSACIALRKIGPSAASALPALRQALSDPSEDVREFARLAIESIER